MAQKPLALRTFANPAGVSIPDVRAALDAAADFAGDDTTRVEFRGRSKLSGLLTEITVAVLRREPGELDRMFDLPPPVPIEPLTAVQPPVRPDLPPLPVARPTFFERWAANVKATREAAAKPDDDVHR